MLETTFVFIKQLTTIDGTICVIHFNTTSVFIKRLIKIFIQHQEGISIQLLFLLNNIFKDFDALGSYFNTTSVFIKQ